MHRLPATETLDNMVLHARTCTNLRGNELKGGNGQVQYHASETGEGSGKGVI